MIQKAKVTYYNVISLEFIWIRLYALSGESSAVYKGAIGTLDVLDEYFRILLPHLCMLTRKDLGVKVPIAFSRDSLGVCLAANLDALTVDEADVFGYERVVERV